MLEQLAASEAVLTPDEKELGVAVVDLGGGTTDYAVYAGGIINKQNLSADYIRTLNRNAALAAFTKNASDELGPFGINVTVVHPGLTRTEKTAGVLAARAAATGRDASDIERELGATTRIGRIVDAAEVADVVVFLASPASDYVNGYTVAVDGGWLAR